MTAADIYAGLVGMGMTKGYASQISNGKRNPSLPLAVKIYRRLGVKLGPIKNATGREIDALEKVSAKQ